MPVSGLLALLDDVAYILDDVAAMSKIAAEKTAGIAGDDLAVGAEALTGLDPKRELPIVGKVALGSLANKVVLVPLALALPMAAIGPLLAVGGTFLCYEGVHKVFHKHDHDDEAHHKELTAAVATSAEAVAAVESKKVRQAILTDVVLSAEIVAVSLGAVAAQPFPVKAATLAVVAVGMTVGIYGLVAAIVKIDDVGLHFQRTGAPGSGRHRFGSAILAGAPYLMRTISVVGTVAMLLVGGEIVLHNVPHVGEIVHHAIEGLTHSGPLVWLLGTLASLANGLLVGGIAAGVVAGIQKVVAAVRG